MPHFPTCIKLNHVHNHGLDCAAALKHRDVSDDVRALFLELYSEGYNPSGALALYKYNKQIEYKDEYFKICADRAIIPDIGWCSRLFKAIKNEIYGSNDNGNSMEKLQLLIDSANSQQTTVRLTKTDKGKIIIAICTPLMQRVVKNIQQSGEICFVDSSGNMDRDNHRVFLLMTHCPAGGLPVGCLITEDESERTIFAALELFKEILPTEGFWGGKRGPSFFMTDDCKALRNALSASFPLATPLLCTFHLLQAAWRWLWQRKNNIPNRLRSQLLNGLKNMLYSESKEILEKLYNEAVEFANNSECNNYAGYINNLYNRRGEWALCHREGTLIRNNNTNNYCESAMRVVKDKILFRLKAFNVVQLCHFIIERMEKFYENRLVDIALNRINYAKHWKYLPSFGNIDLSAIQQQSQYMFLVPSEKKRKDGKRKSYAVDMDIGLCTCPRGSTGGPCKHQRAVAKKFRITSINIIPVHAPDLRQKLLFVATGRMEDINFLQNLRQEESESLPGSGARSPQQSTDSAESELPPIHTSEENNKLQISEAYNGCKEIFDKLLNNLLEDPDQYLSAMQSFKKTASSLKTGAALCQALHMFGKNTSRFTSSVKIPVQPTSVGRRVVACHKVALGDKVPLSGTSSDVNCGRPPKRSRAEDHAYFQPEGKKIAAAPHNITVCVDQNKSLGKSHSKQ